MNGLANKVALITGASSGIGRATAIRLAAQGVHVALAARTASALAEVVAEIEARDGRALAIPTDVTDAEQCRIAVERTVEHFGQLDILVCSAGVSMRSLFEKTDLAAMAGLMQVNFFGTLYPTYHAIPHLKQTRGSLVAVSSLVGKRGTPPTPSTARASSRSKGCTPASGSSWPNTASTSARYRRASSRHLCVTAC